MKDDHAEKLFVARTFVDAWLADHEADLIRLRRRLHSHPELSWKEFGTTATIVQRLGDAGLSADVLPHGTGVVCDISTGRSDEPLVALRADIDALPLPDEKTVTYRSTVSGVTHACGHDVHTAVVLGCGLVLTELAKHIGLAGGIRLIFQPAEEAVPGGALQMIAAGALENVGMILALHADPALAVGRVGLRSGPITSATDFLFLRLNGPGGHTARPHLTGDIVYAAARLVTDLTAALDRRTDARDAATLAFGVIRGGSAPNVIPSSLEVGGTLRVASLSLWERAPNLVDSVVRSVADQPAVSCEVDYRRGVPPVENTPEIVALMAEAATVALGQSAISETQQSMGADDFAWYLETVPGAYCRLGVADPRHIGAVDLHSGTFDVDERAIGVGVKLLVAAVLTGLKLTHAPHS